MARPKPSDLPAVNTTYRAGDRVIVRTIGRLEPAKRRSIRRSLQKYAGHELRILFVDRSRQVVELEMTDGSRKVIGGRVGSDTVHPGTMLLDVATVDLADVATVHVRLPLADRPLLIEVKQWVDGEAEWQGWFF